MKKGKFIVFDGMDGSGKGTQLEILKQTLSDRVLFTREPGSGFSKKATQLREMLLDKNGPRSSPLCDFFCFWADRAVHMEHVVIPALDMGINVVSDRGDSSTLAFQMHGEEQLTLKFLALFEFLRQSVLGEYIPDAYIIFDLPAKVAFDRCREDAERKQSRFDLKPLAYHERVREGFLHFAEIVGRDHVHFIDADRPIGDVHKDLPRLIHTILSI